MSVPTFTASGSKAATAAKLDKTVFELEVKSHELLKQVYLSHDANVRQNLAVTKTRGLVRGGGKKPWKQKGTGRARFGSSRVPIWRGGGVVFGPTGTENYTIKINVAAKRTALRQALSLKAAKNAVIVVEDIDFKGYKTSEAVKLLTAINATGKVLIAVQTKTPQLERAFANLQGVALANAAYLSTHAVMDADVVVMTSKALTSVQTRLKTAVKEAK
jgi:large subunit ribosomal protein L4